MTQHLVGTVSYRFEDVGTVPVALTGDPMPDRVLAVHALGAVIGYCCRWPSGWVGRFEWHNGSDDWRRRPFESEEPADAPESVAEELVRRAVAGFIMDQANQRDQRQWNRWLRGWS